MHVLDDYLLAIDQLDVTRPKPLLHEIGVLENTMHAVTDPRHYGDGARCIRRRWPAWQ